MHSGIRLVYVPGNHDMTLSHKTLEDILPGIVQSRDVRGLGRYRTGRRGEIVIEHSHRYDMFCAPDIITNKEFMKYGEPVLPEGYFFARVGVTSFLQGMPEVKMWRKVESKQKKKELKLNNLKRKLKKSICLPVKTSLQLTFILKFGKMCF